MFKAFKYKIYPTEPQKELIAKHIGSSRFVYNLALETKNTAYIGNKHNYSAFDLVKQLPELKKELPWLKEVNSQSLQQSVQNMVKNHNLAQAISDASWSTFVSMLEYKADWYGKNILRIGTFTPSSKTCSNCGTINKELQLKDREWFCSNCSTVLDRDVNAACNIKSFALKNILSGIDRKNQNELPRLRGVLTSEATSLWGVVVH